MELAHFESLYPDKTRFTEIEMIISYVNEGNSCQLVGLPGAGRGTVLSLLVYNRFIRQMHLKENHQWINFVIVDFSEMRGKDLFNVTKYIFLCLLDSLRQRQLDDIYTDVNELFKEGLSFNDEMVLFQALKHAIDYLAIDEEMNIVLLFDRFEDYIPYLNEGLFSNLRILRHRAKYRFSVVFSLNKPLEDLIEPSSFAEFHEFLAGHIVYLSLKDDVGLPFRLDYMEKATGKHISSKIRNMIIDLTAGHGKLTRLAAEAYLVNEKKAIEDSKFADFLLAQRAVKGGLKEIWRSFNPAEQLWLLGKNRTEENKNIESYFTNLQLVSGGKITIPLLERFLLEDVNAVVITNDKIEYDVEKNLIHKGSQILSDNLTASELRLLKYFLLNPGMIIDREKVIDVVWEENKSTFGVTEQALDQLILRLRKKIEDNPGNPRHIVTIKGRGFKFTP